MARFIDMTDAQRANIWGNVNFDRKANGAAYIADAERDVVIALRRWASDPERLVYQRLLRDAQARLEGAKAAFG